MCCGFTFFLFNRTGKNAQFYSTCVECSTFNRSGRSSRDNDRRLIDRCRLGRSFVRSLNIKVSGEFFFGVHDFSAASIAVADWPTSYLIRIRCTILGRNSRRFEGNQEASGWQSCQPFQMLLLNWRNLPQKISLSSRTLRRGRRASIWERRCQRLTHCGSLSTKIAKKKKLHILQRNTQTALDKNPTLSWHPKMFHHSQICPQCEQLLCSS